MAKEKKHNLDVVVETPKGARNKYVYEPKEKAFRLKKILPAGSVFPFDFGFIPGTKGEDGDPLDVLLIMDEPAHPGCIVETRIIGALKASQTEEGETVQNDRLIGVCTESHMYSRLEDVDDLDKQIKEEIKSFFVSYNQLAGKQFEPKGWADANEALKIIERQRV